jgi:anhydro-N-acetylmuramic acid kinase
VSKLTTALGLMSGTSLDGIDIALIKTDGENIVERGPSATFPYTADQQEFLRHALRDALSITERDQRPGCLADVEHELTDWHIAAVKAFCGAHGLTNADIDLVSFHGQTVLHRPAQKVTVQLGNAKQLARALRVPVAYDLRAADVAAGGQGAPLVPVYHRALAAQLLERPVAFINIGGVGNITWIGADGAMLAFDTGPGNAMLNDWTMHHLGEPQDTDGALALCGKVDEAVLGAALSNTYFSSAPPKSLDRNSFSGINLDGLSPADGAATLVAFTCQSILLSLNWLPTPPKQIIICGGGRHNPAIMKYFQTRDARFITAEAANFNGDAMEAEAWAYLGVRCLKGWPITFPSTTRAPQEMTGGVIVKS